MLEFGRIITYINFYKHIINCLEMITFDEHNVSYIFKNVGCVQFNLQQHSQQQQ